MNVRVRYHAECDGCGDLFVWADDLHQAIDLAKAAGWRVVERLLLCPQCPRTDRDDV